MDTNFWHQVWKDKKIGFHQETINEDLKKYWSKCVQNKDLNIENSVIVPLCGKAKDLVWLADNKLEVTGIELSKIAIDEFYSENTLTSNHKINLVQKDFFEFDSDIKYSFFYDRACYIALSKNQRINYVEKLSKLLQKNSSGLLISLYVENREGGPPFSITDEEIKNNWGKYFSLELLNKTPFSFSQSSTVNEQSYNAIKSIYILKKT